MATTKKAAPRKITQNRTASEERANITKHARKLLRGANTLCVNLGGEHPQSFVSDSGDRYISWGLLWDYISDMDRRARKAPGGRKRGV